MIVRTPPTALLVLLVGRTTPVGAFETTDPRMIASVEAVHTGL
jgi:hypothetical protein